MFVLSVLYCQVEVFATGRSLVQRSSTDYGVSEYDQVERFRLRKEGRKTEICVVCD